MALSTFIIPPVGVTKTLVYVPVTRKTGNFLEPQYKLELLCCNLQSSNFHYHNPPCENCPLNVKEACTAKPHQTCYWGRHVTYAELSDEQREAVDRTVYLNSKPE